MSGQSLGLAYVWFVRQEFAQLAARQMNGKRNHPENEEERGNTRGEASEDSLPTGRLLYEKRCDCNRVVARCMVRVHMSWPICLLFSFLSYVYLSILTLNCDLTTMSSRLPTLSYVAFLDQYQSIGKRPQPAAISGSFMLRGLSR
ncbi:hypothetical protein TIFTF001_015770 [Ficus carica]|uniref:Uncharacterized protein n=1 Tax=Ficus carica TaxID=3494 RepID=A0AA88D866_FICCA|nr:hypothetical protein TIFTF001_015770 [Ficus carica]